MDWETDGSDSFFFFNDTATTEIYTLSLHDALPIWGHRAGPSASARSSRPTRRRSPTAWGRAPAAGAAGRRSEEHTSELQSQSNLVCRLLLEKKKNNLIIRQCLPTCTLILSSQLLAF